MQTEVMFRGGGKLGYDAHPRVRDTDRLLEQEEIIFQVASSFKQDRTHRNPKALGFRWSLSESEAVN